jgi:hypothetical protein
MGARTHTWSRGGSVSRRRCSHVAVRGTGCPCSGSPCSSTHRRGLDLLPHAVRRLAAEATDKALLDRERGQWHAVLVSDEALKALKNVSINSIAHEYATMQGRH